MFSKTTPRPPGRASQLWVGPTDPSVGTAFPAQKVRAVVNMTTPDALGIVFNGSGEYLRAWTADPPLEATTQSYQSWFNGQTQTRRAYFGFGNVNNDELILMNEQTSGVAHLMFGTSGIQRYVIDVSGRHTWAAPSITGQSAFTFQGINGNNVMAINQAAGTGTAFGVVISAGTNASDYSLLLRNQAAATQWTYEGTGRLFNTSANFGAVQVMLLNGVANQHTLNVTGNTTSGQSFGIVVLAGTTSADTSASFRSSGNTVLFAIRGDGGLVAPGAISLGSATSLMPGVISRCTAAVNFTSNTTLAALTGMNVTIAEAGGIWTFEGVLFVQETTASAGGIKIDFSGGTVTVNGNDVSIYGITGTTLTVPAATGAIGTVFSFATIAIASAVTAIWFKGFFAVNATGTFGPRAAQNTSSADTTTVLAGSWMRCHKIS